MAAHKPSRLKSIIIFCGGGWRKMLNLVAMNRARRLILTVTAMVIVAGILVWARFVSAENSRMTAGRLGLYARSIDLSKLTEAERLEALRRLADKSRALPIEERRKWWMSGEWRDWFAKMTEFEKTRYVEETMPVGLRQVLDVFDEMPAAKRKLALDAEMKYLKDTHQLMIDREPGWTTSIYGTNPPLALNPDLENKVIAIGLKTFYSESSGETKAEMAPLLEELQRQMQSERIFR